MKLTKMNLKSLFVTKKREKRLSTLTEEINHFLLYGEHPEETLEEGPLANLTNQIRKLEEQLLYERNVSQNREQEFTHFKFQPACIWKNYNGLRNLLFERTTYRLLLPASISGSEKECLF